MNRPAPARILVIRNAQRARSVHAPALRRVLRCLLQDHLRVPAYELGLHLVGTQEMAALNQAYLQHEGSTDVITFDHSAEPPGRPVTAERHPLHGEIYISIPDAVAQAAEFNTAWTEELLRYAVHGILHLQGHDDLRPGPRRVMKRAENRLVQTLGRAFPPAQLERKRKPQGQPTR